MNAFTFPRIIHREFELIYCTSLDIFMYRFFLVLLPELWHTPCTRKLISLCTMPATNDRPISILLFNNLETIYSMIRRLLRTTYKYIIPPLLLSKFLLAFRLILILIVRVLINDEFLQPLHLIPHLSHQVILPL